MAISRAQMMKELVPGLNALFGQEYARYDEEHKAVYDVETSDRSFEEEVKLSGFGAAPTKTEGARIAYDTAQEAYTSRYTHETIAMGYSITEEAVEDNLYEKNGKCYTAALARAMAYTKQVKAAYYLNNAFAAATNGGDGVSLCNASHPTVGGGVNSNTAGAVDLNETSLEAAIIQMSLWTDERGLLIAAQPKKLVLPPALSFVVVRLLDSELQTNSPNNDINALRATGAVKDGYTINHYLTDNDAWFLKTDVPNGMKHFIRTKLTNGMEGDFETGNMRYKSRERYSFGYSDPLAIIGSSGAP